MNTNNNFLLLSCVDGLRHTNSNNNFLLSFCVFFCVNGLRGKGRDLSNRNRCWGWRFTHLKQIANQTGDSLLLCALQLLSLHPPSKTTSASCSRLFFDFLGLGEFKGESPIRLAIWAK